VAGSLAERLQLIVEATTDKAEGAFRKLSGEAEKSATAATATGNAVATAADRVALARAKEADAAGKVTVAQARLDELLASGSAKASQLAAAEERVAVAQRQHAIASGQLTTELEAQRVTQTRTAVAHEEVARTGGLASKATGALVQGAALLVGVGLVEYLSELPGKFVEGARESGQLAQSMNATTAQASQFLGLVGQLGLDLNDLIEIQAEFAQKVGANAQVLGSFGAAVQTNKDGTTNWVLTIEDALANLQQIPDATKRNQLGFQLFGEEGYKQLSRLLLSGVDLKDALEQIGVPFTDDDIAAAQEYDAAMRSFSITTGNLERTLGRALLPILTEGADLLAAFVEGVQAIPAPLGVAVIAALALGRIGFDPLAFSAGKVAAAVDVTSASLVRFRAVSATAGIGAATMGTLEAAAGKAKTAVGGLTSALGGPLGIALVAGAALYAAASAGAERFRESARKAAVEVEKAGGTTNDATANIARQAQQLSASAGYWDRVAASAKGLNAEIDDQGGILAFGRSVGLVNTSLAAAAEGTSDNEHAVRGYKEQIEEARKELGEYGAQQEAATLSAKSLNDLIAEGTTHGKDFGDAVKTAADAQNTQAYTSDLAKAAIDAYNAVSRDAVQVTYDLISARLSAEDAEYGFLDALDAVNGAQDDAKTSVDEVAQAHTRLKSAALDAASAAADAAVDAAKQAGTIVDPLTEANIRAQAMIDNLRAKLNTPGMTDAAKADVQGLIDQLVTAQEKGDINALVTLTGADDAGTQLDETTADRDTTITVESRGGPAVAAYLDGLASAKRLAIVNVESRGGPDVADYLDRLRTADRLALIRVESRGGPAVDSYLDSLAHERLAIIRVETRGGPDVDRYLDSLAAPRTATINAQRGAGAASSAGLSAFGLAAGSPALAAAGGGRVTANVTLDLELVGKVDRAQLTSAQRGRAAIADIRAYERDNGTGWRR
jgi:hypothetical protein